MLECPSDFVDLEHTIPDLKRIMAYGSANNFTGAPLPGYAGTHAWLHADCAQSLLAISDFFKSEGLRLRLYDAYRPIRAVHAMVAWAEREQRTDLIEAGYIAGQSRHSKGCAVDVSLEWIDTGEILDMGTPWDHFSAQSHSLNAEGHILENRMRLRTPFVEHGWRAARTEWWHFDREAPHMRAIDVPYPAP